MTDNVKMIKVNMGMNVCDVIANVVEETATFFAVEDATMVGIDQGANKIQFGRFDPFGEGTTSIFKTSVIAISTPVEKLKDTWLDSMKKSGIIKPEKPRIIIPE